MNVTMKHLLEAGVHFGHQRNQLDPRMKRYIFAERNGVHILDLQKTYQSLKTLKDPIYEAVRQEKEVLFVGTKKQAQDLIREAAERCGAMYVNKRWLGGFLTNFSTIKRSVARLHKIEAMEKDGTFAQLGKKEISQYLRRKTKLLNQFGGVRDIRELPGLIFVLDPKKEQVVVAEANRCDIPVIAVVDTNCNPDNITYPIPGNDDAVRSISLFVNLLADLVLEARDLVFKDGQIRNTDKLGVQEVLEQEHLQERLDKYDESYEQILEKDGAMLQGEEND